MIIAHECVVSRADGERIVSGDGGESWLAPWFVADRNSRDVDPIFIPVKYCPFCGELLAVNSSINV